jgi:uncharacterized protein (DUF2235 family)
VIPSNVTRICRAIKAESSDQIPQTVFYQAGIGSTGGKVNKVVGGATAEGIATNIREGYDFICQNYIEGDELFFIGFSRGAFTARSIAGLIDNMGVLTKAGLPTLSIVFKDFENRANPNYESPYPNDPFPNKPSAKDPRYKRELERRGLTRLGVPIKAVAVWETVGSLGIPRVPILERLGLQSKGMKEYTFYDTSLGSCIEHAFHALALDERRASFQPAVWEKARGNKTILRQVWFPGVHSNLGGGYPDQEVANITLAWMIAQLEQFLDFDENTVRAQYQENKQYYLNTAQEVRPWSFGEIYNSVTGVYKLGGTKTRTPGFYTRVDPDTGKPTKKTLRDTNEYVHPSVRARTELHGPGVEDRGTYDSRALDGYKLKVAREREPGEPLAVWESITTRKGRPKRILAESPLWETERRLLSYSPEVYDYVLGETRRPRRRRTRRERDPDEPRSPRVNDENRTTEPT